MKISTAKNQACTAIVKYLELQGWKSNSKSEDESAQFNYIDPITGICHRADFAYIVQSERDIYNLKNK